MLDRLNVIWMLVFVVVLLGCKTKAYEDMASYISQPENGLSKIKTFGDLRVKAIYKPTGFLVNQMTRNNDSLSKDDLNQFIHSYSDYYYFIVKYSIKNRELSRFYFGHDYKSIIENLTVNSFEKVFLISEKRDTLILQDYIYTPSYHHGAETILMYYFKKEEKLNEKKLNLIINEVGLMTGSVDFEFSARKLNKADKYIVK